MNIYQMRHMVLARHLGERLTPTQLKVELLERFPGVKSQSVNASDCHYSNRKRAGSTCPECGKLGGFAVNREGVVDMGASGFESIPHVYVPTGNRHIFRRTTDPAYLRQRPKLQISPSEGVACVREYNATSYRGRRNTALDRDAYRIFSDGFSFSVIRLVDQIAFVGEQYGGAQERFGSIRNEAALIAANLYPILNRCMKLVTDSRPLIEKIPEQGTLDFLFSPFRGTKQWPVWASKTLHFLRPDVFPILDSNAKKPLDLVNLQNSSHNYYHFVSVFRDVLLANGECLGAARVADGNESPTDLKLLDKILFQLGLRMK
jgi:hypothetical protein